MKTFDGKTHYEILKIPFSADLGDIKRAYREALDIYEENSLATYALFSDAQRTDLLQAIDEAYLTLIDEDKRAAYNQMLIDTGRADAAGFLLKKYTISIESQNEPAVVQHRDLRNWVKKKLEEEEIRRLVDDMIRRDLVSGGDLKRLREALGIDIAEIFEMTRISKTTLTMIEENKYENLPAEVFLKAFLKSYAEILQIDPQRVIDGYLKHKALSDQAKNSG